MSRSLETKDNNLLPYHPFPHIIFEVAFPSYAANPFTSAFHGCESNFACLPTLKNYRPKFDVVRQEKNSKGKTLNLTFSLHEK